jgi:hypothetical protein
MSSGTEQGWVQRGWSGWCGFWFRPTDPTPLAMMRIVAGLLTLYVHIAYCLDLKSFFGENAWYERSLAERSFREFPILVPPEDPDRPIDRFPMPSSIDLRKTIRQFVDNINADPEGQRALALLMALPADEGSRLEMVRYLNRLSLDYTEREVELTKMVAADKNDDKSKIALPSWLLEMPTEARAMRKAEIQRLLADLPQDLRQRAWIMDLMTLWQPEAYKLLRDTINRINTQYPDPAQRVKEWDYIVFWGLPRDLKDDKDRQMGTYTEGHWYYSPFFYVSDARILWFIHALHLTVIVLFTIGFCTRVTSVLTWLAALAYVQRNPIILFGQDTMMNLCLFYLMMSPCGAIWSVDALIARYRRAKQALAEGRKVVAEPIQPLVSAGFVIRMIQVHYCLMYLSAGLSKLKGNSWWNGTAPFYTMNNPEFSPVHILWFRDFVSFLCQHKWLWEAYMSVGVVFTLVVEIGFPFCVWTRLRPVYIAGAILLHLGIALNMGLHVFSLFMFALLLAFMTPDAIRRVFARPPARLAKILVRFSGSAEPQRKAASLVHALDVWDQAELQDRGSAARIEGAAESVEVTVDGSAETGPTGLRAVLRSLPLIQPVAWLIGPAITMFCGSWFAGSASPVAAEPKKPISV